MTDKIYNFKKISVINVINSVAISLFFIRALTGNDLFLFFGVFLGGIVFIYYVYKMEVVPKNLVFVSIIIIFSYGFTLLNNGFSHGGLFIILFFVSYGIAWNIAINGFSYLLSMMIFYIPFLYFTLMIFWFDVLPDEIFSHSRNQVSVYFINAASLVYIAAHKLKKELSLWPVVFTFLISVLSVGIGGIISSGLFFGLIVYFKLFKGVENYKLKLIFTVLILGYLSTILWGDVTSYLIATFNIEGDMAVKLQFSQLTSNNQRYPIWTEYINKLDIKRLLFGINLSETFSGYANLHNSYFLMHARMGFFSFILMATFIFSFVRAYIKNYVLAVCLFVILFRGLTDTTFLAGSSFDFILVYLMLFSTKHTSRLENGKISYIYCNR